MVDDGAPFQPGIRFPTGQVIPVEVAVETEDANTVRDLEAHISSRSEVTGDRTVTVNVPSEAIVQALTEEITEEVSLTEDVGAIITDEQGISRRIGDTRTGDSVIGPALTEDQLDYIVREVENRTGRKVLRRGRIEAIVLAAIVQAVNNLDEVVPAAEAVLSAGGKVTRIVVNILVRGSMP